jgi:hypothetical protein
VFFDSRTGRMLVRATASDLETIANAFEKLNAIPPQVMFEAKFVELSAKDAASLSLERILVGVKTDARGVISIPQFRILSNLIEQATGGDILTAPRVTTLSGRPAHIGADDHATLDLLGAVAPDGFSIALELGATIKLDQHTWQVIDSREMSDGQTLVISRTEANQPPETAKRLLLFVTPRIIDPAGNPVHSDADLSKKE